MHTVFDIKPTRFFGSDNASAVHPKVMEALAAANRGHQPSYGDDPFTGAAEQAFDALFERPVRSFFVYNGTGANCAALTPMLRPHQSVVCAQSAHIYFDECGAPEHLTGSKLQPLSSPDGKISIEQIAPLTAFHGNMHHAQPRVISITQATEFGTVYTLREIRALTDFAHAHGMLVHVDGARIANAAASLRCTMADLTWRAGVDALSFGGTKNGLMFGEAVVFFQDALADQFVFIRKNCAQLASKMRYISAQYLALLSDELWLRNAEHANAMAARLADELEKLPGARILQKVEANELFVSLPRHAIAPLCEQYFFYIWDEEQDILRLVTSWDTQEEEITGFLNACRALLT